MVSIKLKETNGLVLAYLGDSVWELYVREYFVSKGLNLKNLNNSVVKYVNAKKQSEILRNIISSVEDENYKQIINKGKNGNIKSYPQTCSAEEYREATGFEAYIAALYVNGEIEKIKEIIRENINY